MGWPAGDVGLVVAARMWVRLAVKPAWHRRLQCGQVHCAAGLPSLRAGHRSEDCGCARLLFALQHTPESMTPMSEGSRSLSGEALTPQ